MPSTKEISRFRAKTRKGLPFTPYSCARINATGARYRIIIGERSNGKTYDILEEALIMHRLTGKQFAYVRREQEDLRGKRAASLFAGHIENGLVEFLTDGVYNTIVYYAGRWFYGFIDEEGHTSKCDEPIGFAFSLSNSSHDKSSSFPKIGMVIYDEFIDRRRELPDEFVLFMNLLSTIIRFRDDVIIYMMANTVNVHSPYFKEMGLTKVRDMKPGSLDTYVYGDSGLKVAIEYTDSSKNGKPSDVYFAFDNPKLNMITGGTWEMDIYPHLKEEDRGWKPKDIMFEFFMLLGPDTIHCKVIDKGRGPFIFIHRKTTDIQKPDRDLVFCPDPDTRPNWRQNIRRPTLRVEQKIAKLFTDGRVYYQSNEIGEIVNEYLKWCGRH